MIVTMGIIETMAAVHHRGGVATVPVHPQPP